MSGREALIAAAVSLFQARGYHGVGVADILARAGLPKGSLYHHFPGGKEALAVAAIEFIADEVTLWIEQRLGAGANAFSVYAEICESTARWLEDTGFSQGALIGGLAAADVPALAAAAGQSQRLWIERLAAAMPNAGGIDRARTMLAALEGAIIMARAARDAAVLRALPGVLQPACVSS
jgi:TetR/AcrR family transcriptional repressor of lmrAB and yxaGH operons